MRGEPGDGGATVVRGASAWALALAFALAAGPYLALVAHFDFVCDDAFIAFRYAKNWAAGRGLVYNPGAPGPPVEGYTNFLWVAWTALFERLDLDVTVAARASSVACGLALLGAVLAHARRRLGAGGPALFATGLLLGTLPPFAVWSTGGLATVPLALAAFLVYDRLLVDPARPRTLAALLAAGVAVLLRADGVYFVGLVLAVAGLRALGPGRAPLRRAVAAVGIAAAAALGAHAAGRLGYYGDVLPNTARVKAGLSAMRLERGASYVAAQLANVPSLALAPLLAALAPRGAHRVCAAEGLALFAGTAAYAVLVGGDFMAYGRFLVAGLPFAALAAAAGLAPALAPARPSSGTRPGPPARPGRAAGAGALLAACLAASLLPALGQPLLPRGWLEAVDFRFQASRYRTEREYWAHMKANTERWTHVGRALALVAEPEASLVAGSIGAIGYYSGLRIHDLYGLTNRAWAELDLEARRRTAGHDLRIPIAYFLERHQPTYGHAFLSTSGPESASELPEPWSELVHVEVHALPAGHGLPPGAQLYLLRFREGLELEEDAPASPGADGRS